MSETDNVVKLLDEQRRVSEKLEREIDTLFSQDLSVKNDRLNKELESARGENEALTSELKQTKEKLSKTETLLYETMLRDKRDVLLKTDKRINDFFLAFAGQNENRLVSFERQMKKQIDSFNAQLDALAADDERELRNDIFLLEQKLDYKLEAARAAAREVARQADGQTEAQLARFREEKVTADELDRAFSKKSVESFVGLNLLNKIGVLLLIIGTVAVGKFAYENVSDIFRFAMMCALGGVLLGLGEFFSRKGKNDVFSQGLLGCSCAVFFVSVAVGYLYLDLFSVNVAFIAIAVVTVISYILSMRHDSQAVAAFALVGGYFPAISFFSGEGMRFSGHLPLLIICITYLLILCAFNLVLAFKKDWKVSQITGFVLNFIASMGVYLLAGDFMISSRAFKIVALLYIGAAFLIYALIPPVSLKTRKFDAMSLALTVSNAVVGFIFLAYGLNAFFPAITWLPGIVPVLFSAIYIPFAVYISKNGGVGAAGSNLLTMIAALSVMLIVPLAFDVKYWAFSWIAETALMTLMALKTRNKPLICEGIMAMAISYGLYYICLAGSVFTFDFTKVLTMLTALVAPYAVLLLSPRTVKNTLEQGLGAFAMFNGALSGAILVYDCTYHALQFTEGSADIQLTNCMLTAAVIAAAALLSPLSARMKNKATSAAAITLCGISFLFSLVCMSEFDYNGSVSVAVAGSMFPITVPQSAGYSILNISALVFALAVLVTAIIRSLTLLRRKWRFSEQASPLIVSAVLLILTSSVLMAQFDLSFSSYLISLIYIVMASAMVVFGFVRRYRLTRLGGLILSFLALGKLFLFDLYDESDLKRIISYFAFGGLLIGISYVYRHFEKKLKSIKTETADPPSANPPIENPDASAENTDTADAPTEVTPG